MTGGSLQAEPADDVASGLGVGGSGEGDQRHLGEELAEPAELHVFRAEIMSPLGDTVCLINGEEGDGHILEPFQKRLGHQPFRRHIEQIQFLVVQLRQYPARGNVTEGRIVKGSTHTVGAQGIHLVLHQGDERRDDNADPGPVQRRNLVAERLAAAGRHNDEGILAVDQAGNDLRLRMAEGMIAKYLEQGFLWISVHSASPVHQMCLCCIEVELHRQLC